MNNQLIGKVETGVKSIAQMQNTVSMIEIEPLKEQTLHGRGGDFLSQQSEVDI
jgi:hypothetical protein